MNIGEIFKESNFVAKKQLQASFFHERFATKMGYHFMKVRESGYRDEIFVKRSILSIK